MALVLQKAVQVHDEESYPGGGPLATIPAGRALADIPEWAVAQLHVDHFINTDDPPKPGEAEKHVLLHDDPAPTIQE